jgi:hypothetical protein
VVSAMSHLAITSREARRNQVAPKAPTYTHTMVSERRERGVPPGDLELVSSLVSKSSHGDQLCGR